ncbi:hypothetical protein PCE1_002266 [Barthelona sp. PCE]
MTNSSLKALLSRKREVNCDKEEAKIRLGDLLGRTQEFERLRSEKLFKAQHIKSIDGRLQILRRDVDELKKSVSELEDTVEKRRLWLCRLDNEYNTLYKNIERTKKHLGVSMIQNERFKKMHFEQKVRCISDLGKVFICRTDHENRTMTICGIPFEYPRVSSLELIIHALFLSSKYLSIPLLYPMSFFGVESFVVDFIDINPIEPDTRYSISTPDRDREKQLNHLLSLIIRHLYVCFSGRSDLWVGHVLVSLGRFLAVEDYIE